MPFGLKGAPATFQLMIDKILDGLGDFAGAYLDDVIVFSTSWDDHLAQLNTVLGRIKNAGLTIKKSKCPFAMKECVYLGHKIGSGTVTPDVAKVQAIS